MKLVGYFYCTILRLLIHIAKCYFRKVFSSYSSYQQYITDHFLTLLAIVCIIVIKIVFDNLIGISGMPFCVLICISLITSNFEHFILGSHFSFSFCAFPISVLTFVVGLYINFGFRHVDLEVKTE